MQLRQNLLVHFVIAIPARLFRKKRKTNDNNNENNNKKKKNKNGEYMCVFACLSHTKENMGHTSSR